MHRSRSCTFAQRIIRKIRSAGNGTCAPWSNNPIFTYVADKPDGVFFFFLQVSCISVPSTLSFIHISKIDSIVWRNFAIGTFQGELGNGIVPMNDSHRLIFLFPQWKQSRYLRSVGQIGYTHTRGSCLRLRLRAHANYANRSREIWQKRVNENKTRERRKIKKPYADLRMRSVSHTTYAICRVHFTRFSNTHSADVKYDLVFIRSRR